MTGHFAPVVPRAIQYLRFLVLMVVFSAVLTAARARNSISFSDVVPSWGLLIGGSTGWLFSHRWLRKDNK